MKLVTLLRTSIAAMLSIVYFAVPAQAQVTIYGSIDNGITHVNNYNGHSNTWLQDGLNRSNALGFNGVEDLGNGNRAIFKLETGFSVNNGALGQGGLIFGKQAYVGLSSDDKGQLTFGRQYDMMIGMLGYLPCWACGLFSVQNADLDRLSGQRLNNSVRYQSRAIGRFRFNGMYALGSVDAGSTNRGRALSFSTEYENGPLKVTAITTDINGAAIFAGLLGTTSVLGRPVATNPILIADNQRIMALASAYSLGNGRLAVIYTDTRLALGKQTSTDHVLRIGGEVRLLPQLLLLGQISEDHFERSRWRTLNLGLTRSLSKRTDIYIDGAYQRASGAATVASIALTAPSSNASQVVTRVGIKHMF
ncbi:porin [Glaciimonas sp. GG7]